MSSRIIRTSLLATLLIAALTIGWAPAAGAQAPVRPADRSSSPTRATGSPTTTRRSSARRDSTNSTSDRSPPQSLASHQVVLLSQGDYAAQAAMLDSWVRGGGNLIAMRPTAALAGLLGLGADHGDLSNQYLRVAPGRGITGDTMQFHGTADLWSTAGATPIATLFSGEDSATSSPAVTLRGVGTGQAAAFTFDLARSIVYTRQGNPAWAGMERDFALDSLTRSDDLFFGAKPGDIQPDWVNLDKVAIPQADEQQRLLADLITGMNADRMPLPRFWYLPRGEKAAVVMTGDDHAQGERDRGSVHRVQGGQPARLLGGELGLHPVNVVRLPGTPACRARRASSRTASRSALHLNAGCPNNFTPASLRDSWDEQLPEWRARVPDAEPRR